MEVVRITPRGYCHDVVDAFRIAKRVREETNGPVHMLGMLVHNTHATDDLQAQGIALVDPPDRSVTAYRPGATPEYWQGGDRVDLGDLLPELALTVEELFGALRLQ